jgi:hypothetical protein
MRFGMWNIRSLYRKGKENHELGNRFSVYKGIISAVKRVQFLSDRMSYITLRGHWCHCSECTCPSRGKN